MDFHKTLCSIVISAGGAHYIFEVIQSEKVIKINRILYGTIYKHGKSLFHLEEAI